MDEKTDQEEIAYFTSEIKIVRTARRLPPPAAEQQSAGEMLFLDESTALPASASGCDETLFIGPALEEVHYIGPEE